MSRVRSIDLRSRVLAAVAESLSHRTAAARVGVSAASISRWGAPQRQQGDARPMALGGDRRSGRIEAQADLIQSLVEEMPDITIEELRQPLAARRHSFGFGTIRRFFRSHLTGRAGHTVLRITRKNVWPAPLASRFRQALFSRAQTYPA